uniref:Uncharacterized protein n=1 Tax=viral metagenome TaxID=1070528 RepID=A0A6C0ET27_9ZZZZ
MFNFNRLRKVFGMTQKNANKRFGMTNTKSNHRGSVTKTNHRMKSHRNKQGSIYYSPPKEIRPQVLEREIDWQSTVYPRGSRASVIPRSVKARSVIPRSRASVKARSVRT